MTLGYRLKNLIEERQITRKELAQKLSISLSTLNGYMQDAREPDFATLMIFADYFNVPTDYLIGYSNSTDKNKGCNLNEFELLRIFRLLTDEQQSFLIEQGKLYIRHNNKKGQISSNTILKKNSEDSKSS